MPSIVDCFEKVGLPKGTRDYINSKVELYKKQGLPEIEAHRKAARDFKSETVEHLVDLHSQVGNTKFQRSEKVSEENKVPVATEKASVTEAVVDKPIQQTESAKEEVITTQPVKEAVGNKEMGSEKGNEDIGGMEKVGKFNYEKTGETEKAVKAKIPYWEATSDGVKKHKQLYYEAWIPKSVLAKGDEAVKQFVLGEREKRRTSNAYQKAFHRQPESWKTLGELAPSKEPVVREEVDYDKMKELVNGLEKKYNASLRRIIIDGLAEEAGNMSDQKLAESLEFPKLKDPNIPKINRTYFETAKAKETPQAEVNKTNVSGNDKAVSATPKEKVVPTEADTVKLPSKIGGEITYTFKDGEWQYKDSRGTFQRLTEKERQGVENKFDSDNGQKISDVPPVENDAVKNFQESITPAKLKELLNKEGLANKTSSGTGATKRLAGDYLYNQDKGAFDALLNDIKSGANKESWRNLIDIGNSKTETPVKETAATKAASREKLANDVKEKGANKAMADWLREKKIRGALSAVDFGITQTIYNGAIDLMSSQIEKGTKVGNALAKAIKYIDEKMGGKSWNKAAFGKEMSKTYTVKVNGKDEVVERDDTKETAKVINGFYSPLEQRILEAKASGASAKQWLQHLNTDEAKWTGVRDFLESKGNEKVSKEELKEFMKNNRIEIVEVVKGESRKYSSEETNAAYNEAKKVLLKADYLGYDSANQALHEAIIPHDNWIKDWDVQDLTPEDIAVIEKYKAMKKENAGSNTKYETYQLAGEKENYKEVLVTLPNKTVADLNQSDIKAAEQNLREIENEYGKDSREYRKALESLELRKEREQNIADKKSGTFKSSHWEEPNILVHLRMNERVDAEGKKVLFVEEVQSDWGQKGKKEGFDLGKGFEAKKEQLRKSVEQAKEEFNKADKEHWDARREVKKLDDEIIVALNNKDEAKFNSLVDQKKKAEATAKKLFNDRFNKEDNKFKLEDQWKNLQRPADVPSSPFVTDTNAWVKMGLKVALKNAVESGAERLSWVSGEQSNERYDLSKQVDEIVYTKKGDGTYTITANKDGVSQTVERNIPQDKLQDFVGKEVASKIIKGEGEVMSAGSKEEGSYQEIGRVLSGQDLKIGGKGMKGFYGEPTEGKEGIIGGVAKALVRELTGKEGEIVETKIVVDKTNAEKYEDINIDKNDNGVYEVSYRSGGDLKIEYFDSVSKAEDRARELPKEIKNNFTSTQHSIEITPELKESVKQGMPLFGEAKPQKFTDKIRSLAQDIREGKVAGFGKGMEGVEMQGSFGGKSFQEASARALELVALAIDSGLEFTHAVEVGFQHIKKYYQENTKQFDASRLRTEFEDAARKHAKENQPEMKFRKADIAKARERAGLNLFSDAGRTTNEAESVKAQEIISTWKDEGTYRENLGGIQQRILSDEASLQDSFIFAQHLADLDATVNNIKDIHSSEYDAALREYGSALDAADMARSNAGRKLGMIPRNKGEIQPSLADIMVDIKNDSDVDVLTEAQKDQAVKHFNDIKEAFIKETTLRIKAEEELNAIREEREIDKIKEAEKKQSSGGKRKTFEERNEYRKNLKKSIAEKWRNAGKDRLSMDIPYRQQLAAIAPDVARLVADYVEQAADITIDKIRILLKKDLEDAGIEVSDREVRGLIAGEYNEKKETRSGLVKKVTDFRTEEKLLLQYEALLNGEEPTTEKKKIERNQKLTDLRNKIKALTKGKLSDEELQNRKFISTINARITANKKEAERLIGKLKKGDFAEDPIKETLLDNKELQQKNPKLYADYLNSIIEKESALLAYEKTRMNNKMRNLDAIGQIGDLLETTVKTTQQTVAMVDMSVLMVQMLPYTMSHPIDAPKFVWKGMKMFVNERAYRENMAKTHYGKYWQTIEKSGLAVYEPYSVKRELQNEMMGGEKSLWNVDIRTKVGGKDVNLSVGKAFERMTSTLLNEARINMFLSRVHDLERQKKTFATHPEEYKAAARVCNELTAHGTPANVIKKSAAKLNYIIWSTKMFSSTFNVLGLGDLAHPEQMVKAIKKHLGYSVKESKGEKGYYTSLTPRQAKFAVTELGRFIATTSLVMLAYKLANWNDDETEVILDPRSSQFGSIKTENKTFPMFGRFGGVVRTLAQVFTNKRIDKYGHPNEFGDTFGEKTAWDAFNESFLRGKMTPIAGFTFDYFLNAGKNTYTKEPLKAQDLLIPMSAQGIADDFRRDSELKAIFETLYKFTGGNIRDKRDFSEKESSKTIRNTPKIPHIPKIKQPKVSGY